MERKLLRDLKKPFKLDGFTRIDETPVHKAVREALANCIANADFNFPRGIVIKKELDSLVIENPGSIITGKAQMLKGGISEPRNKAIMKMFNLIRVGERAGSGVPDIFHVWEDEGWMTPIVEEQYKPDRTILRLSFTEKEVLPDFLPEKEKHGRKSGRKKNERLKADEIKKRKETILQLIRENSSITINEIVEKLEISRGMAESTIRNLKSEGKLVREGSTKAGKWIIKDL